MEEELKLLEQYGIFIHLNYEHYDIGTNCLFQIEFKNKKTMTCQFGDNHEFGNTVETINAAIQLAKWYHNDESRIDLINSGYHNPEYIKYKHEYMSILQNLYCDKLKKNIK